MKLIEAGKVSSTHGVNGLLKIFSYLEDPKNFSEYKFYINESTPIELDLKFVKKNQAICSIEGVATIEEAQKYCGKTLFINREELPNTSKDEFYYSDLEGLEVICQKDKLSIGKVIAIHNFGAGDILEIKLNNGKNEMFNFNDSSFPEIDISGGTITANLPEIEYNDSTED